MLTMLILKEFFDVGLIENDYFYQKISNGKIKDMKELETLTQITIHNQGLQSDSSSLRNVPQQQAAHQIAVPSH